MGGIGEMLKSGFYPEEADGQGVRHWTEPECMIDLPPGTRAAGLRVSSLYTSVTGKPLRLRIESLGGRLLAEKSLAGPPECIVVAGEMDGGLRITSDPSWAPAEIMGGNDDRRRLGFCLHGLDPVPVGSAPRAFARLADYIGPGWFPVESDGASDWAWMSELAILLVPPSAQALAITVACPHVEKTSMPLGIAVTGASGRQIANRSLAGPLESFILRCEGEPFVLVRASRTWTPVEIYGGEDRRRLSVCLHAVFGMDVSSTFAPFTVEVELTTRCNINPPCVQCYPRVGPKDGDGRADGEYIPGGVDMPRRLYDKIFPTMREARVLSLHGIGEPLLTPLLRESLEQTDAGHTYRQFNSNGLLLNPRNCEFLIRTQTQYCNVSLDAASEQTFRTVRGEGWPIIMRNLRSFTEMKRQLGVSHPLIAINMTLMKVNYREAPAFVDLANELGVQRVIFSKLEPAEDYFMDRKGFLFKYSEQYVDSGDEDFRATLREAFRRGADYGIETVAIVPNILG